MKSYFKVILYKEKLPELEERIINGGFSIIGGKDDKLIVLVNFEDEVDSLDELVEDEVILSFEKMEEENKEEEDVRENIEMAR